MSVVESFLTDKQEQSVIKAIQQAEKNTSGEIRVHIDNTKKPTLEHAKEVFLYLKMDKTRERNGVLFYINVSSKYFVILGDVGINKLVSDDFWEEEKQLVIQYFSQGKNKEGLVAGILKVGEKLKEFFPYQKDDSNELSDEISKGEID
jgi:uncharacterized membrane protein